MDVQNVGATTSVKRETAATFVGTVGIVKVRLKANDLELSEAYAEVLEAGLEALETQDQQ